MDGLFSVAGLAIWTVLSISGLPLGLPPGPEDPVIAKAAPEQCVVYLSWTGMAAPDPNSSNQTEQLLAEPEVRHCLAQVEKLVRIALRDGWPGIAEPKGQVPTAEAKQQAAAVDAIIDGVKACLTHPAALFVTDLKFAGDASDIRGGLIVSLGDDGPKLKETMEKHLARLLEAGRKEESPGIETVTIAGRAWYRMKWPGGWPLVWGFHKTYFLLGVGDGSVEATLARMEKEPPGWLMTARRQVQVERRATMTYINVKSLRGTLLSSAERKESQPLVEALGLDNIGSLVTLTGLEGDRFVSRTLLAVEGEPRLLRLVSDRPLTADDLAPIPRDATLAAAVRLDMQQAVDLLLSVSEKLDPKGRDEMAQWLEQLGRPLGIDLRRDVLPSLGDVWCVYNSPGEGGVIVTGLTAVVPLRRGSALSLAAVNPKLIELAKKAGKAGKGGEEGQPPPASSEWDIRAFPFADRTIFYAAGTGFVPAWCLTEREFVVALSPQNVKAYLSRRGEHKSLAGATEVSGALSALGGPSMMGYSDTPKLFELIYPIMSMVLNQYLATVDRPEEGGAALDPDLLPSAPAIGRHLRPGVTTVRRTKEGIELCSRVSLPGGGLLSPLTWMTANGMCIIPLYSGDPARRTQEMVNPSDVPPPVPPAAPPAVPGAKDDSGKQNDSPAKDTSRIDFLGPKGLAVSWDVDNSGKPGSESVVCPGRSQDFRQGGARKVRLTKIPGWPDGEVTGTIETAPAVPRTEAFFAHNAIPVQFTEEDFAQVRKGVPVTKVIYLPDPQFRELALGGVETLVATRLDPGVDPIKEAERRGAILAVVRIEPPGKAREVK